MADQKLSTLKRALSLIGVLAFITVTVGALHYADALTDEAIEKDRRPQRVAELYGRGYRPDMPQSVVLLHPMDCAAKPDATVNQRVYYAEAGRTRCYSRSAQ